MDLNEISQAKPRHRRCKSVAECELWKVLKLPMLFEFEKPIEAILASRKAKIRQKLLRIQKTKEAVLEIIESKNIESNTSTDYSYKTVNNPKPASL